jgi:hypothetical protein
MDWTEGTVLLVSDRPVPSEFPEIGDSELRAIRGGDGYTCTELLQEYDVYYCSYWCDGYYEYYPERWGCESAPSGMCTMSQKLRCAECPCIHDLNLNCTVTGEWNFYYMLACA